MRIEEFHYHSVYKNYDHFSSSSRQQYSRYSLNKTIKGENKTVEIRMINKLFRSRIHTHGIQNPARWSIQTVAVIQL